MSSISDLRFDDKNINKHTEYGMSLLEKSLRELGAGRSILIDKDNRIIAGNGIVEAAAQAGITKLKIVETDGDTLVAVKRPDMELDTKAGRQMAMADNTVADKNRAYNKDMMAEVAESFDIDTSAWGMDLSFEPHDYFGDERERTYKSTNLDLYNAEHADNKYGFPELKGSFTLPTGVVGFNEAKTTDQFNSAVHFFIDDYQFERLWNAPKKYIDLLKKFRCIFTPDFSLYTDMPLAMKIWNVYRSRLVGQIMEDAGIDVIPTLSWAGDDTLDFVFDGLPEGGVYAVSTVGVMKDKDAKATWVKGMQAALNRVKPDAVVLYGAPIEIDWGDTKVVNFKAGGFHGV